MLTERETKLWLDGPAWQALVRSTYIHDHEVHIVHCLMPKNSAQINSKKISNPQKMSRSFETQGSNTVERWLYVPLISQVKCHCCQTSDCVTPCPHVFTHPGSLIPLAESLCVLHETMAATENPVAPQVGWKCGWKLRNSPIHYSYLYNNSCFYPGFCIFALNSFCPSRINPIFTPPLLPVLVFCDPMSVFGWGCWQISNMARIIFF